MRLVNEVRPLIKLRLAVGVQHLLMPELGAKLVLGRRLDRRACLVARVLGARYLAQALVSGAAPTGAVLALGAEVDAAHAASMIMLGLLDRPRRREALASALVAGSFAVAGMRAARDAATVPVDVPGGIVGLAAWRDHVADQVARRLVPGYPWYPGVARRPDRTDGVHPLRRLTTSRSHADQAARA